CRRQPPFVVRRVWSAFITPAYRWSFSTEGPRPFQGPMRHWGFAFSQQARHDDWPNRVRHPTDESFTSRCSPPRLLATQLRSVTRFRPNLDEDLHLADNGHLQAH